MSDCEFKAVCYDNGVRCLLSGDAVGQCESYCLIKTYMGSDEHNKFYANRVDLVEAITKSVFRYPVECREAMEVAFTKVVKIIDTKGKDSP